MPNQYTMKILFMIDQSWFDTVGINIFCNKLGQNLEKLGSQQKTYSCIFIFWNEGSILYTT